MGLLATVAATLLSSTRPSGAVALEWTAETSMPVAGPVDIPGGGSMKIEDAAIRAADANATGYRLFRVAGVVRFEAGSAIGQGRLTCRTAVAKRTSATKGRNSRGAYPKSSEALEEQEVSERVQIQFSSNGTDTASLELRDAFPVFSTLPGVVVSWPTYLVGAQDWQWGLPDGVPEEPVRLGFASVWRTSTAPEAKVTCKLETGAGEARAQTSGSLPAA